MYTFPGFLLWLHQLGWLSKWLFCSVRFGPTYWVAHAGIDDHLNYRRINTRISLLVALRQQRNRLFVPDRLEQLLAFRYLNGLGASSAL